MARLSALLTSAAAAAVAGLGLRTPDGPVGYTNLVRRSNESYALDPELVNVAGEKFHITQPGPYLMIGVPETADLSDPDNARILVEADFQKTGTTACEDLLIRSVTIQGYILGTNVSKIVVSVANDVFNSTAALGLELTQVRSNGAVGVMTGLTPENFMDYLPGCSIFRPRGYIKAPTKASYRQRTRIKSMECTFMAQIGTDFMTNIVIVHWSTVYRGMQAGRNGGPDEPYYNNDISFSVSDVGTAPVGLLGTDDHTDATKVVAGCNKAQPVGGLFQTRLKGPKGKPWQRRYREQVEKRVAAAEKAAR